MSASSSNLSSAKYGYDFVVATTQASINATLKEYLSGSNMPEVVMCYVMDNSGNPQVIDYATLVKNANGTDPFSVPDGANPATNQGVKDLAGAFFMYAFKAKIGLPPGIAPQNMPDIVSLGANTASVGYSLMCSEFVVVEATYGPRGIVSWLNKSQPSGSAWLFNSKVDLRLVNTDQTAYGNLPPAVQKQIKNLGGNAFSVQQLLFDLDNAALESVPTISGVEPGTPLYTSLQQVFLGAYFTAVKKNGQPVLGYSIAQSTPPPSTLTLTDLNFNVNPFMGTNGQPVLNPSSEQKDLATLNYLCAADNNTLPAASQFAWNWVDPSQQSDFNGVIAVNGLTFSNWLGHLFGPSLASLCFKPNCSFSVNFIKATFSIGFQRDTSKVPSYTVLSGQAADSEGFVKVLTFTYSNSDESSDTFVPNWGNLSCKFTSTSDIYFYKNQIKIVNSVNAFVHLNIDGGIGEGNWASYQTTELFTLSVDSEGTLVVSSSGTKLKDNSEAPNPDGWLKFVSAGTITDAVNKLQGNLKVFINSFISSFDFQIEQCLNSPSSWVFPGGKTFTFKGVTFSDHQDLITYITYVQPTGETLRQATESAPKTLQLS